MTHNADDAKRPRRVPGRRDRRGATTPRVRLLAAAGGLAAALVVATACGSGAAPPAPAWTASPIASLERQFLDARDIADQVDIARSRSDSMNLRGVPVSSLKFQLDSARTRLLAQLDSVERSGPDLSPDDDLAVSAMRETLESGLTFMPPLGAPAQPEPSCRYDARALLRSSSPDALRARMATCYAAAQRRVTWRDSTFDRLGVFQRLRREPDPQRRRELFMALEPVWRTVNGDGGPTSPYRLLLPGEAARWRADGSPAAKAAAQLGIAPDSVERWLVAVLEAWRDATAGAEVEPWDFRFVAGAAARRLSSRLPVERIVEVNHAYFTALGANPDSLRIRFDLDARPGKTAVAFTTFGARPRLKSQGWTTGEPWVFATYSTGGLGNLGELLHETGHGIHIAAIRTRPAYADWPESNTWTEALADIVALDAYEPTWQQRWLGDSATTSDGLRAKYASVVMDIAWSLFELRVHAAPAADPNRIWTGITHEYLHITPHPELSWWALRGQLIDSPGYMLNYALGAMIIADIRAALRAARGDWTAGDAGWYADVSDRLYRFGRERNARDVIADFLGRPFAPAALLSDLARMRPGALPPPR